MDLTRLARHLFGRFKPDLGRDTLLLTAQLPESQEEQATTSTSARNIHMHVPITSTGSVELRGILKELKELVQEVNEMNKSITEIKSSNKKLNNAVLDLYTSSMKKKRKFDQNDKPSPSPKRTRKELSIENKMDLIKDSEAVPKISQKDLSLKYGIVKATVYDILKRKDTYRTQYEENIGICGESADVNLNVVAEFKSKLAEIVKAYDPRDTFNADETGLFFRALPDKTLAERGKECKGGKMSKQRLTVMLCCSVRGEKLKPLVIGNANKPRCFRNLDVKSLPVTWKANKKSWMNSTFFTEWVKDINRDMRKESRKIVTFLDNATSHSHNLKLRNV
ncbi:Hypothetical predicted protein [Mytilus galloprovincialis]|uniref:DDE-1 domain-containing protein n=1 Tax=Mytilus galloprovincialis TaxID=29158 RepID=A0A8B6H2I5_MYTGA|nr:Hypothetical predicted protein [Mytilus galloprovincialis]